MLIVVAIFPEVVIFFAIFLSVVVFLALSISMAVVGSVAFLVLGCIGFATPGVRAGTSLRSLLSGCTAKL